MTQPIYYKCSKCGYEKDPNWSKIFKNPSAIRCSKCNNRMDKKDYKRTKEGFWDK